MAFGGVYRLDIRTDRLAEDGRLPRVVAGGGWHEKGKEIFE